MAIGPDTGVRESRLVSVVVPTLNEERYLPTLPYSRAWRLRIDHRLSSHYFRLKLEAGRGVANRSNKAGWETS